MMKNTPLVFGTTANPSSSQIAGAILTNSTLTTGSGETAASIFSRQEKETESELISLPVEIMAYIVKMLDMPSTLALKITCHHFRAVCQEYESDIFRQYEDLFENLLKFEVEDFSEGTLLFKEAKWRELIHPPLKGFNQVTIPLPKEAEWNTLAGSPLKSFTRAQIKEIVEEQDREKTKNLIKEVYIKAWNIFLQPRILNDRQHALDCLQLLVKLSPYISNAEAYATQLFSDKDVLEMFFKRLAKMADYYYADPCFQLVTKHFSINDDAGPAHQFILLNYKKLVEFKIKALRNKIIIPLSNEAEWDKLKILPLNFTIEKLIKTVVRRHRNRTETETETEKIQIAPLKEFIKKVYIGAWDVLLQPEINQKQTLVFIKLLLDLLPYISNAEAYATQLFSDKHVLEMFFKQLAKIADSDLDRCLQLVTKHFPVNYGSLAHQFILAQCPPLSTLRCLEKIKSGQYPSFLFYIVENFHLFDSTGSTPTRKHKAISELFDQLLSHGGDFNQVDRSGNTPLMGLLDLVGTFEDIKYKGKEKQLCELVEKSLQKIDCNIKDEAGNTLLIKACIYKIKELVPLLLNQPKIDIKTKNKENKNALQIAIATGDLFIVKTLLSHLDAQINTNKNNGLFIEKSPKVENLLQKPNIDLNIQGNKDMTNLHIAATYSNLNLAKTLLELKNAEIDMNVRNKEGATPLHIAMARSNWDIVQLLLAQTKINVNVKDNRKASILDIAISRSDLPHAILQTLLQKSDDRTRLSAFNEALWLGKDDIAAIFLQHMETQKQSKFINQAFALAEEEDQFEVAEILCEKYHAARRI
jgi:ankyrin repeat protein